MVGLSTLSDDMSCCEHVTALGSVSTLYSGHSNNISFRILSTDSVNSFISSVCIDISTLCTYCVPGPGDVAVRSGQDK